MEILEISLHLKRKQADCLVHMLSAKLEKASRMCTVCGLTDLAWQQDLVSLTELEVLVEKLDATKNGGSGLVLIPCLELLQPLTLSRSFCFSSCV